MCENSDLNEEKFVEFLKNLDVETYGLSFEWMLDEDEHGLLRWIYENINHKNALTKRETNRYRELDENGKTLPEDECNLEILNALSKYDGLVLPGDKYSLESLQLRQKQLKERKLLLMKQDEAFDVLIEQNELANDEINQQISLITTELACAEIETSNVKEACLKLSDHVEKQLEDLVYSVGDYYKLYTSFNSDKSLSEKLYISGPIEKYMQNRKLFRSHFNLYTTRQFDECINKTNKAEHQFNMNYEAKLLEERLYNAILLYIESLAELNGVYNKIDTVTNYKEIHPSQLPVALAECSGEVELLRNGGDGVECCETGAATLASAHVAALNTARALEALTVRKDIYSKLCELHKLVLSMCSLDNLLYYLVKRELIQTQDFIQFSTDVKRYIDDEVNAVNSRMQSMMCIEQEILTNNANTKKGNMLVNQLREMLNICNVDIISNTMLDGKLCQAKETLQDSIGKKIIQLDERGDVYKRLENDATLVKQCTHNASDSCRLVRDKVTQLDNMININVKKYTQIKGKECVDRKLWQWFITDHEKFLSSVGTDIE